MVAAHPGLVVAELQLTGVRNNDRQRLEHAVDVMMLLANCITSVGLRLAVKRKRRALVRLDRGGLFGAFIDMQRYAAVL